MSTSAPELGAGYRGLRALEGLVEGDVEGAAVHTHTIVNADATALLRLEAHAHTGVGQQAGHGSDI